MSDSGRDVRKRAAAERAAERVTDGMVVGLGTGSTVRFVLEDLGRRLGDGALRDIVGVPTSEDTFARATALGIPLGTLAEHPALDLTIDGADEVDPALDLIKGLGGALLREKIVAAASAELVVVVDDSKVVERLGTRAPLPVEVDRFGAETHPRFLRGLGARPELRRTASGGPFLTDGGHLIYDCHFPDGIVDARALEDALARRPGILETGLFLGMATEVVVAGPEDVRVLTADRRTRG